MSYLDNKIVMVTGGTGTVGGEVVKALLVEGAKVIVYSRDQNKQFTMAHKHDSARLTFINGDILDKSVLSRAMKDVEYAIHCAAAKHVPLCESNPDNAVKVNVEGTRNVLECAQRWNIRKFLLLSTDKAVYPTCVMGATKMLAERITLEFNKMFPCSVVRLGNVFASNGSVVPTFMDRIEHSLPIIVNNPAASRYFISKKDAGSFIVRMLESMSGGEVFIKKMKVMTIMQLAEMISPTVEYEIRIGELTQGEKIKEVLITQEEASRAYEIDDYIVINGKMIGERPLVNPKVEFFTNDEVKELLKGIK